MRKKIFVMLFILFTALQNVPVGSANSSKTIDSWDKVLLKELSENANSSTKKVVITKKELKTEIKKRTKSRDRSFRSFKKDFWAEKRNFTKNSLTERFSWFYNYLSFVMRTHFTWMTAWACKNSHYFNCE